MSVNLEDKVHGTSSKAVKVAVKKILFLGITAVRLLDDE